jgi:putative redox protein
MGNYFWSSGVIMDAKASWVEGLSFDAVGGSGFSLRMGTAMEQGGANDGFRPMELILVGLAGCTAMDVISILKKKQQDVTAFEVLTHGDREPEKYPRVFTKINIEYVVTGHNISRDAVERAVELSETKYCSVQAMLVKSVKIEHSITIHQV